MVDIKTSVEGEQTTETSELTDGFHLVIDALKLNGINTIYNVPGIPITDLGRLMQASGMRILSFRHEQNAGDGLEKEEQKMNKSSHAIVSVEDRTARP